MSKHKNKKKYYQNDTIESTTSNEAIEETTEIMIDAAEEVAEAVEETVEEATAEIIAEESNEESIEKTRTFDMEAVAAEETTETKEFTTVQEDTDAETEVEDDDEYEYVTPHYARNAILLTLFCVIIGACVSFILFKDKLADEVRNAYIQQGYMITNTATATASDIRAGKTAYVRGVLIEGCFEDVDTSQATATASDILAGYTAYVDGVLITGTIPSYTGSVTIMPSNSKTVIKGGQYIPTQINISGSDNLIGSNIKSGVSIFGVKGTYSGD